MDADKAVELLQRVVSTTEEVSAAVLCDARVECHCRNKQAAAVRNAFKALAGRSPSVHEMMAVVGFEED